MTALAHPQADIEPRHFRPLTDGELLAARVIAVFVGALGLLGFINSFRAVSRAAVSSFGELAPTLPIGIDLGIAVFSALDLLLAKLDMRPSWLRAVPWALTAATIYLNVADQHTWLGRIGHAAFPALWVLAVEVGAHVVRVRAQLAKGKRMDRIRLSRWFLAPLSTALLNRRMVLWEITSYPVALAREVDRVLARTELQDEYGAIAWRWRAPRRERALYRVGMLAPAAVVPAAVVALTPVDSNGPHDADSTPHASPADADSSPHGAPHGDDSDPHDTPPPPDTEQLDIDGQDHDGQDEDEVPAPPAALDRAALVAELVEEFRAAIAASTTWRPDYPALMARTGKQRRWCEYAVSDARNQLLGGPDGADGTDPADPKSPADSSPHAASNDPHDDPHDADSDPHASTDGADNRVLVGASS